MSNAGTHSSSKINSNSSNSAISDLGVDYKATVTTRVNCRYLHVLASFAALHATNMHCPCGLFLVNDTLAI